MRASNSSATRPATSGMRATVPLDDDGNGAAVGAPCGSRDVAGTVRAQEDDHGRDLLGLGEPAQWTALRHAFEYLVAGLAGSFGALVGEPAGRQPGRRARRPRGDRVAEDPILRVEVGDEAGE